MSHRYSNRRWPDDFRGQLYGAKARLRELCAERRAVHAHLVDLEGANAALITEVNALRTALRGTEIARTGLAAELRVARSITRLQARIIAHQGDELVRCTEALGVVLHTPAPDLAWAHAILTGGIRNEGTDR